MAAPMSTRRKLMIATWDAPREGNIYGKLRVDATEALAYVAWKREQTGEKVTITHLVGKACAQALKEAPGLNGVIRLGTFVPRESVDVTFLVALEEGKDLGKAKVCNLDQKPVSDVAAELRQMALKLRSGKDAAFEKSKGPLKALPSWVLKPLIRLTGYLSAIWGVNLPALGLEPYPFGSCIVTNVGVFGLDEGWAPPTPFAHVPIYVLMGAVRPVPTVRDGAIVIREEMTLCATIDHRYMDGAGGAKLAKTVRRVLEHPFAELEGMDGPPAS
ncbi:MAG: pyruvate/2-oxoglutarate dehydrogenase complex dihydrolipoamide acyltransferase (E2) component [Myxococcota bacterium]|jgi:pyruvate/2-oxoglutarate dehydrogenase complex dihydrolipoamide acyltransferase (E2) component